MHNSVFFLLDKAAIYSTCFRPLNVRVYESYAFLQSNFVARFIFRNLMKFSKDKSRFFNQELKDCMGKAVLAFDVVDINVIRWIRENNPRSRIVIFFINTIQTPEIVEEYRKLNCELWSFDKGDCEKYNMQFNDWYCTYIPDKNIKKKFDVCFIGREKTRRPLLNKLASYMDSNDISYYYHVTHERNYPIVDYRYYRRHIPYSKMIEIEKSSVAMIEIVEPGQGGSTLRVMDAVFNNVKLITNYAPILDSDLYNPSNIFVLKDDNMGDIKTFLGTPFEPYSEEIMYKYSFNNWISKFKFE